MIFPMNVILPRNWGESLLSCFDKSLNLHTFHHILPFLDSLIPTVMIYYFKTTFYYYSKFMYTFQENVKKVQ